jgi:NAD(P)-dependent dehydrogenase (short-subunit alcohol dehydrogenase family)
VTAMATGLPELAGRVAVVTGAAGGLGLAMARRFATEGMRVVLSDVDPAGVRAAAASLAETGAEVRAVVTDVSRWDDVDRLADETYDAFGAVHVLCANAGVAKSARAWLLTREDWEWVLGVNLWGVVHTVRAFVPRMLDGGEAGHVVTTASMTALLPMPKQAVYGASKAAVATLSESLLHDLVAEGADIGVSVFCPGWVATGIAESARNRPPELAATAPSTGRRTAAGVTPLFTTDEAAAQVVDAVRTGRFWVLTHQDYRAVIRERAAGIGTDARPQVPPVW